MADWAALVSGMEHFACDRPYSLYQRLLTAHATRFRLCFRDATNALNEQRNTTMIDDGQRIWVLADDRAGNRSQVLGVATCLRIPVEVKNLSYGPLAGLPNVLLPVSRMTLDWSSRRQLIAPWPDLVIAAGRRTALIARYIKRISGGSTRLVQIMNPGGALEDFDLLCVPTHDPAVYGENVITITGAPHGITRDVLADARSTWMPKLVDLPAPRIALMVGGSTRRRTFTDVMAADLATRASAKANAAGGSLLVSTSRRTGTATSALIEGIDAPSRIFQWGNMTENPYVGFLACADVIIVTGDSISMCTESCASGVPVYLFAPPDLVSAKHGRFHQTLRNNGYVTDLASNRDALTHPPLNPGNEIADAARKLMGW